MKIHKHPADALQTVASSHRVFLHGAAATPTGLIDGLVAQAARLNDVELVHLHTEGSLPTLNPNLSKSFKTSAFFLGANMRPHFIIGQNDYIPCFLSEIPQLFRSGRFPIDVALIQVSPPDSHGFCTLGTSVDIARAAVDQARVVVAEINQQMPRVHGDGLVHIDRIHHAIEVDRPLPESLLRPTSEIENKIGQNVASLVEDGATIQVGIGSIPDAVWKALTHHRFLGIHSEMWSDGAIPLLESGAIDNSRKTLHPGVSVSSFLMGSRRLYDFVDDNPSVIQLDVGFVNSPSTIARNPKVTAINSCVEIDLTGQVCSDSVGTRIVSGVGGQMDFIRGASLSPGGKPIIAVTSRTRHGHSRIVPVLQSGAGVVTTRAHVHYVVTEYGIADLYGQTLKERARRLIAIAHPDDRAALDRNWRELYTVAIN